MTAKLKGRRVIVSNIIKELTNETMIGIGRFRTFRTSQKYTTKSSLVQTLLTYQEKCFTHVVTLIFHQYLLITQ